MDVITLMNAMAAMICAVSTGLCFVTAGLEWKCGVPWRRNWCLYLGATCASFAVLNGIFVIVRMSK